MECQLNEDQPSTEASEVMIQTITSKTIRSDRSVGWSYCTITKSAAHLFGCYLLRRMCKPPTIDDNSQTNFRTIPLNIMSYHLRRPSVNRITVTPLQNHRSCASRFKVYHKFMRFESHASLDLKFSEFLGSTFCSPIEYLSLYVLW